MRRLAAASVRRHWVSGAVRTHSAVFRLAKYSAWPAFDLLLRICLAEPFLVHGAVRMMGVSSSGPGVLQVPLAQWMSPLSQLGSGAGLQLTCAALLAVGLFTQPASLGLLLAALAGATTATSDSQLLLCVLLASFLVGGAGPLSLDHVLGGLASSALTPARPALRAAEWLRRALLPVYQVLLRAGLAVALLLQNPLGATIGAVLLVSGAATRYIALLLLLRVGLAVILSQHWSTGLYWTLALGLIAFRGPGGWSVDAVIAQWLRRNYPELDHEPSSSLDGLPRVVIVGAGFGGLACAEALRRARVAVTLIDRSNHHLFQPLLYQVATASLSPGDIAVPIRSLFRESFNVRVLFGTVTGVDARAQVVALGGNRIPYDYLVLASGATHGYFGRDEWQGLAPGLKRLEDATEIRRRLLTAFELAELTEDAAERGALLTFLVVGGGPTGVELAGAIAELARLGMHKEFRRFDPADARVILVQSAPRILPTFPEPLSSIARRSLEQLGVEVRTGQPVETIDHSGVRVSGEHIPARTVLWAAGVVASPAARWLGAAADRAGRVIVGPDLSVPGMSNVYAIGDTAASRSWAGHEVPGLAPAAKQAGVYVARTIRRHVAGRPAPPPFEYRHRGSLATIGRKSAVADFGNVRLWGAPGWWLWGTVHVGLLLGLRNRVTTVVNWFWSYVTFKSAIRLITGADPTISAAANSNRTQDSGTAVQYARSAS